MQRTLLLAFAMVCALPTFAQADDWSVHHSGFNPRLVQRYKALLHRRPNDGYALAKLIKLYKQHRTVASLIAEYRRRADAHPKSFVYQVIAGHLYRRVGERRKAITYYQRAAALRPKSPSVPAALGALYRRTNQSAQAVTAYQRALALAHSKRQKKRYLRALANMALARRDLPSARAFFKKLVSLDPRNIFLRIELAQALARAKLRKEAITQYQHILARTRDSGTRASVLKSIGKLQHELGRTDAAVATYRKAMRLAARGHWIRRELTDRIITIYREKEDLKGLIAYYKKRWKHRGHFEWNILGRLYDETGDEIRATKAYRAALKKKSRAIDTRVRLIALLERSGHGAEVIAEYRKLAYLASAEPRYQFELAKRLHRAGKGTEAIQVLERVARRFPRDASVHSALADLFARWGKRRLALREARKLVQIEPRDASHIVNLGEQYFLRGNKRRALEVWKRLLSAIPQRHRAYAKLASIYGDHDMVPKAIKLYKKAIKLKPKLIPYRRALALLLEGKRLYHKALGAWKTVFSLAQAQKAQQTLREARTHTIDIMHRTYHLKQEIRNRARLFAQSPPDIEAGFFIAEAYRKTRNIKKSVRTYVQILVFRPKNVEALSALESAYRSLHRYARAVKVLKRLASLQPKRRREYYQRIADLELLLYNDKEAVIYAQKAVTLGRQDARAYQRLGELYEKKEDFKAALKAYKKALTLNKNLPGVHFAMARLYTRRGLYDLGEEVYRTLLRTARTPENLRRAFRKGVVLSSYLGRLDRLEKTLLPLAVQTTPLAETYRKLLVAIYRRRVPLLIDQARQGNTARRRRARETLARIGTRGMAPLLDELANPESTRSRRRVLLRMLGYLGNPNAVLPLLRLAEATPQEQPIVIYSRRTSMPHRSSIRRHFGRHRGGVLGRLGGARSYRQSGRVAERVAATIAVGRLADRRAVPGLLRLLKSREGAIRDAASWALAKLRGRKVATALFNALGDRRATVQMMACVGLGIQRKARFRPVLEEVTLDHERSKQVRAACAWGLGAIADKRSSPVLLRTLKTSYTSLQRCAAWSLARVGSPKNIPALVQSLWNRPSMIQVLLRIGHSHQPRTISRIPDIQMEWGHINREEFILRLTEDPRLPKTPHLTKAFADLAPKLVQPLTKSITNALARHRDVVLRVLSDLDRSPATLTLGPLTLGRHSLPEAARARLDISLRSIATSIAPAVIRLLQHVDPLVRRRATSITIKLRALGVRSLPLAKILNNQPWRVRVRALATLTNCSPCRRDAPVLAIAARSAKAASWREREAAARLLGTLGPSAATSLTQCLMDTNGFVREAAATALGQTHDRRAAKALLRAFSDTVAKVRVAAAHAAGELGFATLRPPLERLRKDLSKEVRRAAKSALATFPGQSPTPR